MFVSKYKNRKGFKDFSKKWNVLEKTARIKFFHLAMGWWKVICFRSEIINYDF